jgi:hypothetical protein
MDGSQKVISEGNLHIGWRKGSKNRKSEVGYTSIFFNRWNDQFDFHKNNPNNLCHEMSKPNSSFSFAKKPVLFCKLEKEGVK